MAIVTQGYTGGSGPGGAGSSTPASAKPSAVSQSPALSAAAPSLNDILAGKAVSPTTLPAASGPNAGIVNTLVGGAGYDAAANQAQNAALGQQLSSGEAAISLGSEYAQQSAGLSQQQIANQQQQLGVSQTALSQQAALNPVEQAAEVSQYGLSTTEAQQTLAQNASQQGLETQEYGLTSGAAAGSQAQEVAQYGLSAADQAAAIANMQGQQSTETAQFGLQYDPNNPNSQYSLSQSALSNQLGNLTANYNYSLPELASQSSASGALNSGQAQTNSAQNTTNYQYNVSQNANQVSQLQNQLSQADIGQYGVNSSGQAGTAANLGQGGEINQYNTNLTTAQNQQLSSEIGQYGVGANGQAGTANDLGVGGEVNTYNVNQQLAGLGQQSEVSAYNYGQTQGAEALASAKIGQSAETAGYKESTQQIADQQKGLQLAGKALGLSSTQVDQQLTQALQQAGVGGTQLKDQILAQAASGDASTIQAIIQAAELGSPASGS